MNSIQLKLPRFDSLPMSVRWSLGLLAMPIGPFVFGLGTAMFRLPVHPTVEIVLAPSVAVLVWIVKDEVC